MKFDFKVALQSLPEYLTSRRLLLSAALAVLLLLGAGFGWLNSLKTMPTAATGDGAYIRVTSGMSMGEVIAELRDKGVLDNTLGFKILARWNDLPSQLKAGAYIISPSMTYQEIIDMLISGRNAAVMVTIPEGYSVEQIAGLLADKGIVSREAALAAAKDFAPYEYMRGGSAVRYRAEGFLFPDTYEIAHDQDAAAIFKMMADEFDRKLTPQLRQRAAELNMSLHDVVTLASLVEKEARYDEDRPIIAQVFLKRLAIGMPLQSDTTIQYLLSAPKEDVTIADTKLESPYNTYQHMGLPPGPIANPGLASLEAVLYPADTDYLYFVADRQGNNHYTDNYQAHLEVVDRVR